MYKKLLKTMVQSITLALFVAQAAIAKDQIIDLEMIDHRKIYKYDTLFLKAVGKTTNQKKVLIFFVLNVKRATMGASVFIDPAQTYYLSAKDASLSSSDVAINLHKEDVLIKYLCRIINSTGEDRIVKHNPHNLYAQLNTCLHSSGLNPDLLETWGVDEFLRDIYKSDAATLAPYDPSKDMDALLL